MPRLLLAGLLVLTLGLLWVSLAVTTSLVFAERDPSISLPGWHSATIESGRAAALLQDDLPAKNLRSAKNSARAALLQDPLDVVAARSLGLIAAVEKRNDMAHRWFDVAQSFSRRDLPTQLWLIEDMVRKGRINEALQQYNYALSTSRSAEQLLFPVLIAASSEPAIYRPLGMILQKRPLWWERFIDALTSTGTAPTGVLALVSALHLNPQEPGEQRLAARAILRLFQISAVPQAFALYQSVSGNGERTVRNGNFQHNNPLPPFDWELTDQADLFADVTPGPSDNNPRILKLMASNGTGGVIAQQLIGLQPGSYTVSALAGRPQGDAAQRPRLQVSCRSNVGGVIANLPFPSSAKETGTMVTASLDVPKAGCEFQRVQIVMPGSIDGSTIETWITAIELQPRQSTNASRSSRP